MPHAVSLIISCEHGGNEVPPAYAALFAGQAPLLQSHRGWDPGALALAQQMAEALHAPLFAATTTRLLIDLNRSIGHRQLYSEVTRGLPRAQREQIVRAHYRPHRDAVEGEVERCIASGHQVVHIASHSFTPVLHEDVRRADVACLYDPRRPREATLSRHWLQALAQRAHGLQLRCNYPYQGRGDGLTSLLRRRFDAEAYVGVELEVNQRWVVQGGAPWAALCEQVVASLAAALTTTEATREG